MSQNHVPITSARRPDISYSNNDERIHFFTVSNGHYRVRHYFSQNELVYMEHVGSHYLTGNELLYYPELAKRLREVEYPLLRCIHEIDKIDEGLPFEDFVKKSSNDFESERNALSQKANQIVKDHGTKHQAPIINAIKRDDEGRYYDFVEINGVIWHFHAGIQELKKLTEVIDFYQLFSIPHEFIMLTLEGAVIGSPLIALRIAKSWVHKGHVHWYDLNSRQKISMPRISGRDISFIASQ